MNNSFVNSAIEEIKSQPDEKQDEYETISVRPGIKNAALIEVFQTISNKRISSMFTDGITSELYKYCLSDVNNATIIQKVCKKIFSYENPKALELLSGNDCLSLLKQNGAITIEAVTKENYKPEPSTNYDNGFYKEINKLLKDKKNGREE